MKELIAKYEKIVNSPVCVVTGSEKATLQEFIKEIKKLAKAQPAMYYATGEEVNVGDIVFWDDKYDAHKRRETQMQWGLFEVTTNDYQYNEVCGFYIDEIEVSGWDFTEKDGKIYLPERVSYISRGV